MKVRVKFTDMNRLTWIDDILRFQKRKGYIKVIKYDEEYLVDEAGIPNYKIDKDWIEKIVDDEAKMTQIYKTHYKNLIERTVDNDEG
jgi:hypothetical protein